MKLPYTMLIKNCEKGSFAWFHEKRHVFQEEAWGALSKHCVFDELFKVLAVLGVLVQAWFVVSGFVIALFLFHFALEFDADVFALRETGNWRAFLRLESVNKPLKVKEGK